MKFYSFDETTYPGIPDEIGPETRQTNKFCDPVLAACFHVLPLVTEPAPE